MSENDKPIEAVANDDAKLSIGERIQKRRKDIGLSAEDLTELTALFDFDENIENERGISLPTIYRYEKGEREPGAREIKLLCGALNVSADWLVFGCSWNTEQDADSKLANDLRFLVKQASDDKTLSAIFDRNRARDSMHQLKIYEVKSRQKSKK